MVGLVDTTWIVHELEVSCSNLRAAGSRRGSRAYTKLVVQGSSLVMSNANNIFLCISSIAIISIIRDSCRRCPLHDPGLSGPCFGHYLVNHNRAFELPIVPIETFKQIDPVLHIVGTSCLADAVHRQDRVAQVEGSDTEFSR